MWVRGGFLAICGETNGTALWSTLGVQVVSSVPLKVAALCMDDVESQEGSHGFPMDTWLKSGGLVTCDKQKTDCTSKDSFKFSFKF